MNYNRSKKYVVFGDPIPLARARHGKYGVWDSQRAIKHKVQQQLEDQHKDIPPFVGPLQMDLVFYLAIPKKTPKRLLESKQNSFHFIKPDCSNIIKFYEDVGTSAGLYHDDSMICKINAEKRYDDGQGVRTELIIWELSNKEIEELQSKAPILNHICCCEKCCYCREF